MYSNVADFNMMYFFLMLNSMSHIFFNCKTGKEEQTNWRNKNKDEDTNEWKKKSYNKMGATSKKIKIIAFKPFHFVARVCVLFFWWSLWFERGSTTKRSKWAQRWRRSSERSSRSKSFVALQKIYETKVKYREKYTCNSLCFYKTKIYMNHVTSMQIQKWVLAASSVRFLWFFSLFLIFFLLLLLLSHRVYILVWLLIEA